MSTENPWDWDLRVRERNVAEGKLGEKELTKYLSALPDLADQVETFATPQPALDAPIVDDVDEADDEDDGDAASTGGNEPESAEG
ncbi:MAG: hypothetical protein U0174_00430 [Polyangiaceae bacterium]